MNKGILFLSLAVFGGFSSAMHAETRSAQEVVSVAYEANTLAINNLAGKTFVDVIIFSVDHNAGNVTFIGGDSVIRTHNYHDGSNVKHLNAGDIVVLEIINNSIVAGSSISDG